MKIITILGTRPEITKLSPLLPLLDQHFDHKVIHTGQHYDYNMDKVFFEQLKLRQPEYNLHIGQANLTHAKQTAQMMVQMEDILIEEKPDWVLVFADPNTPLAGALVASKLNIPLIHMEAGCRSFNKDMPEEINRIVCDHISDMLLSPDNVAKQNLMNEGLSEEIIHLVGSTAIPAARRNAKLATTATTILKDLNLTKQEYILLTIHRAENTNDPIRLKGMIDAINTIAEKTTIIFPIHPRTKKILEREEILLSEKVKIIAPQDYLNFLTLLANASCVMSDSGGVQEEAAALDVPCLVLRNETEWTYLLDMGKNLLMTTDKTNIITRTTELLDNPNKLQEMRDIPLIKNEDVAEKIIEVLKNDPRSK